MMTEADNRLKDMFRQLGERIDSYKIAVDSLMLECVEKDNELNELREENKLLKIRIKNLLKKGKENADKRKVKVR